MNPTRWIGVALAQVLVNLLDFGMGIQEAVMAPRVSATSETLDLSPEDAARLGVGDGDVVRVVSRRGAVDAPVLVDEGLRPGLCFMTFHDAADVDTNRLTIEAVCPRSGTAEFKAAAVRVEVLRPAGAAASADGSARGDR